MTVRELNEEGKWIEAKPEPYYPSFIEKVVHLFGYHVWLGNNPMRCGICNCKK